MVSYSGWRGIARNMFPEGTTLKDIRLRGIFDKKREGEHHCGTDFVYLTTFPKGREGQNVRIYLRDVMGIPNIGAGKTEERIYVLSKKTTQEAQTQ